MDIQKKIKQVVINPLFWIILVALVLRVVRLHNAYYGTTQELFRDLNVIYDFLVNGKWPLLGPSASIGEFYFGAVYYYILAPFVYLFHFKALGAIFTSTVFSMLSIGALYSLLKLWFGRKDIALMGAALMAVSLYDIQNAYYVSNPNLLPFFILWFLYCLTKIIHGSAHWVWYILLGFLFGIATQLHATALAVLPMVFLPALIIKRDRISWPKIPLAILACVATYTPYIISESVNHFQNLKRIFVVGGQQFSLLISGKSIAAILNFWQSTFVFNNDFLNLWLDNLNLYLVLVVLYTVSVLYIMVKMRQQRESLDTITLPISSEGKLLLLLWAVVGTAVFLFFGVPKQSFYFLVLWPLPIILFAWFLARLKTLDRKLFLVLFSVYVLAQILQIYTFFGIVRNDFYDQPQFNHLMETIITDAGGQSFNVINSNLDQNMFIYYNRVGGYDKLLTRSQGSLLYIIGSKISDYEVTVEPNSAFHQLVEDFSQGQFTIKKYNSLLKK